MEEKRIRWKVASEAITWEVHTCQRFVHADRVSLGSLILCLCFPDNNKQFINPATRTQWTLLLLIPTRRASPTKLISTQWILFRLSSSLYWLVTIVEGDGIAPFESDTFLEVVTLTVQKLSKRIPRRPRVNVQLQTIPRGWNASPSGYVKNPCSLEVSAVEVPVLLVSSKSFWLW